MIKKVFVVQIYKNDYLKEITPKKLSLVEEKKIKEIEFYNKKYKKCFKAFNLDYLDQEKLKQFLIDHKEILYFNIEVKKEKEK